MIEQRPEGASAPISTKMLREFAVLCLLVFGGLACWEWFRHERLVLALIFAGLAVAVGPLGLLRPAAIEPLFVGLMAITRPIGWVVSHVLLAILFYLMFTPISLLFKLIGRDALALRRSPNKTTYWQSKPAAQDVRSYLRQS